MENGIRKEMEEIEDDVKRMKTTMSSMKNELEKLDQTVREEKEANHINKHIDEIVLVQDGHWTKVVKNEINTGMKIMKADMEERMEI